MTVTCRHAGLPCMADLVELPHETQLAPCGLSELEQNRPVDAPPAACLSQRTRRSMILSVRYQYAM